jgi:hypothetical protein
LPIPRRQRPQVQQVGRKPGAPDRGLAALDHRAPGHHRQCGALAQQAGLAEFHDKIIAGIGASCPAAVEHRAVLEEYRRVIAAQCRAQQTDGILGVRRHGHSPPDAVKPLHLVRLAVPGIAAFEEPAGNPHHHGCRESIGGAPTHGAAVIELFGRGIRVFAELDLGNRHEPGRGHTDRAADDAFLGQTGIEHARASEFLLQADGGRVHAALAAHIFAEHHEPRIHFEFALEGAAHRGDQIDPRSLPVGPQ